MTSAAARAACCLGLTALLGPSIAPAAAQVVGRCDLGRRPIVSLAQGQAAGRAPSSAAPASTAATTRRTGDRPGASSNDGAIDPPDDILTACLDGRVQRGGHGGRPRSLP